MESNTQYNALVLFDGLCNFCNSSVNYVVKHDKLNRFKFAPLQSEKGQLLLNKYHIDTAKTDSIVFILNEKSYIKSTAAILIAKQLGGMHILLSVFLIIPSFVRDFIYDFIAKNRYKWFGRKEVCMVPSEEVKSKFIA